MPTRNPAEFLNRAGTAGKLLGLDVGSKRLGLARTDTARTLATSLAPLPRTPWQTLGPALHAQAVGCTGLVVGLPLNMDGTPGPMAQSVTDFAAHAEKILSLPVFLMDERLTSQAAQTAFFEQRTAGSRQTRASSKASVGQLDSPAAVLILQTALGVLTAGE